MTIEEIVFNYLKTKLEDISLYLDEPGELPDEYISMKRIASGLTDHIGAATLEFQCYAPSKYEAAALDEELKNTLLGYGSGYGITETPEVSACKFGGSNDATDPGTKKYRYRSYYNFFY
mgnify:CR=1 FL=1